MFKRKNKAFTLIELIATLVIMAIIALIATPLVMNIIRKARISADKRSVDAYGRSIELAISSHLLDTGKFATSIDELTIEYSGNKVECDTTQINPDSSVYLSNCKVNNREVTNYTYGTDKSLSYETYNVGDEVTYNGVDYYVLKDSGTKDNVVTLLKATPLTTEEVNLYGGVGTENNHVNMYACPSTDASCYQTADDQNGYGGMAYYTSETCGYSEHSGCTKEYENSEVKYVVDAWAAIKLNKMVKTVGLLSKNDDLFEYREFDACGGHGCITKGEYAKYSWLYNDGYKYWTNNSSNSSSIIVVYKDGSINNDSVFSSSDVVRPVVELYKNDGITRKNSGNN